MVIKCPFMKLENLVRVNRMKGGWDNEFRGGKIADFPHWYLLVVAYKRKTFIVVTLNIRISLVIAHKTEISLKLA